MADNTPLNLQEAIEKFAGDLANKLQSFVNDVSVVEIRTYTTEAEQEWTEIKQLPDMNGILTQGKAKLRAYTSMSLDGDTTVLVPVDQQGNVSQAIWQLHQDMVRQAHNNRAAIISSIGEAAAAALKALGRTQ